jgi:hypothetical protein
MTPVCLVYCVAVLTMFMCFASSVAVVTGFIGHDPEGRIIPCVSLCRVETRAYLPSGASCVATQVEPPCV